MQIEELSGYQICHLSNKMDNVLREKRVVLGLTQQNVADRAKITLQGCN